MQLEGTIAPKIDKKEFGHYLKYLRTIHHIQQYKLALWSYKTPQRLSEYENAKRVPTVSSLEAIIQGLRIGGATSEEIEELRRRHTKKLENSSAHVLSAVYQANEKQILS